MIGRNVLRAANQRRFSVVGRLPGAEILKLGWFGYVYSFPSLLSELVLADSMVR